MAYPELRIAIEADGFAVHGTRPAFEDDRARQNRLMLAGWQVLRFTWRQVCRQPESVVDQLRTAVAGAARRRQ
jgi:very-short-patch-repair endonuclease